MKTVIPAQPGWYIARGYIEEEITKFDLDPLVAWLVTASGEDHVDVIPLTFEGNACLFSDAAWAIKKPDGVFEFPKGRTCPNEVSALIHCRELIERKKNDKRSDTHSR